MKTAMQQLIEKLHPNFFTEEELWFWLETEKQQIIDAYIDGQKSIHIVPNHLTGEQYYNETFNQ